MNTFKCVCVNLFMYVYDGCLYVWMSGAWIYVCWYAHMRSCIKLSEVFTYGCMQVCLYVCMYLFMHVCIFVCLYDCARVYVDLHASVCACVCVCTSAFKHVLARLFILP